MKTLLGMTYAQLNTLNNEELNKILVKYTLEKIRFSMTQNLKDERFVNLYCDRALPKLQKIYTEFFTDEMYDFQRLVYDTEEKFNKASDMEQSMIGISAIVGNMTGELMQEMFKDI